jgi:hypothetical protein
MGFSGFLVGVYGDTKDALKPHFPAVLVSISEAEIQYH